MRRDDYTLPRGTNFIRSCIARALAPSPIEAVHYAEGRWGHDSEAVRITRAAVAASDPDLNLRAPWAPADEFLELVQAATAVDRLPGLRRVPANVATVTQTTGATAAWRKQGLAAKVSASVFDRTSMGLLSVGALTIFPNELLEDASPQAEALILRDLVKVLADAVDSSFFDVNNTGVTNVEPASVTSAGSAVASGGDLVPDLQAAFAEFAGQWSTAAFVCHPKLAADIGLLYGGKGVGADVGARGGTLAGLPLLTTEGLSADSSGTGDLILIDAGSVLVCDEGATVARSNVTSIEMDDAPAQDGLAPSAATGAVVSLFQTESTALLASRRINWRLGRAGGCVTVTGCTYAPAS